MKGLVWYLRRSEGISFGASFYIIGNVLVFNEVQAYLSFERSAAKRKVAYANTYKTTLTGTHGGIIGAQMDTENSSGTQ